MKHRNIIFMHAFSISISIINGYRRPVACDRAHKGVTVTGVIEGQWPVTVPIKGLQSHLKCSVTKKFQLNIHCCIYCIIVHNYYVSLSLLLEGDRVLLVIKARITSVTTKNKYSYQLKS